MANLPESVLRAWSRREGPTVFSTVSQDGIPNAVYATCVAILNRDTIVIANNYFDKTLANIQSGSLGSLLFITDKQKSFQIKGSLEYHESGPIFDFMQCWNPPQHPGNGAAALRIKEVWSGAQRIV